MKQYLDEFPFIQTEFKTIGDSDVIFACNVETQLENGDKYNWIHFFMIYNGDINEDLKLLEAFEGYPGQDVNIYKEIEEDIIIQGKFSISKERPDHDPIMYFDTDLNKRTTRREHLSDWMERFPIIQSFVLNYSSYSYFHKLPTIKEKKFKSITSIKF